MRGFGYFLIVAGAIYLLFAFNMDVSVQAPSTYIPGYGSVGGGNVANLDLMARRQNHLIVAALITLIGVLLVVFGGSIKTEAATDTLPLSNEPLTFDGERNLEADPYRLWLAKTYNITRNDVFDKFVFDDKIFASLNEALSNAHGQEMQKINAAMEEEEQTRIETEKRKEQIRIAAEESDALWERDRPKVIAVVLFLLLAIIIGYFIFRETPDEYKARIAREEAAKIELIQSVEKRFGLTLPKDAKNITVTENAATSDYLCDDKKDGTLLKFSTGSGKENAKNEISKSLGEGKSQYDSLVDGNFDWEWQRKGHHFELSMFGETMPTEINLCMTTVTP